MQSSLKRTGISKYTAMLVAKAQPTNWSKPIMLLHFVEANGATSVFVATDEAIASFQPCEKHRIYDVEVPGKCVHSSKGVERHGVKTNYEVTLKYSCKITVSKKPFP
jgi:hypothetical protein